MLSNFSLGSGSSRVFGLGFGGLFGLLFGVFFN